MPQKQPSMFIEELTIPMYTLATVPDATAAPGQLIIITDATPPALSWSNGTVWIASDDGLEAA